MAVPSTESGSSGHGPRTAPRPHTVVERLSRFRRFEDVSAGRVEEQRFLETPDGRLFVTLLEPVGDRRGVGFMVCHSFGHEQLDLFPLEMTFAREAASAGFPVAYFQARGYADSGGSFERATLRSQVRDATSVAVALRGRGVGSVVPVGARWGAAVALLAAGRIEAPGVVLWNPSLDPGAYLDDLLKVFARSRIAGKSRDPVDPEPATREQLLAALASGGVVDLFGYPLASTCYEGAAEIRPLSSLDRAPGEVLVVPINPRTEGAAEQDAAHLRELGARVQVEHAEGPGRPQFGIGQSPAGKRAVASQPLYRDVAVRSVRWAADRWPARSTVDATASPDDVRSPILAASPVEVPLYIGSRSEHLGAVVSVPEDAGATVGVVLLSSRARDRAHRNGLWVKTARRVASDGAYALRLDYPGVGNSSGEPTLFGDKDVPSWAVEDACRFLLSNTPVRTLLLAGTCYGGRVVLEAATKLPEAAAVALVAAPVSRPPSSEHRVRMRASRLFARNEPGGSLEEGAWHAAARGRGTRLDRAFVSTLRRYTARGRVYLLYGDRDVRPDELRSAVARLRLPAERLEVEIVAGEIDSFRSIAMQAVTLERLRSWIQRATVAIREGS